MSNVMIAVPCYDGKIDVWFANSLANTIKEGIKRGYDIYPMYISYDALIQRSRNDLLALAVKHDYSHVFWIDSDIEWDPNDFFKLIESGYDVVGGTYPKKTDEREEYVFKLLEGTPRTVRKEYLEVEGLGTGFLCMTKKAIQAVWDASVPYRDPRNDGRGGIKKLAFDVQVINGDLYSEDIVFCRKLRELGYQIMLNTEITCNHVGTGKKYTGNFNKWFFKVAKL